MQNFQNGLAFYRYIVVPRGLHAPELLPEEIATRAQDDFVGRKCSFVRKLMQSEKKLC